MKSVTFTKHPENLVFDLERSACVYHKQYAKKLPKIPDCEFIEFEKLCQTFQTQDYFTGKTAVVFVGLNKMFTTSTRFHPVWDLLQYNMPAGIQKYCVDIAPYMGPLWRIWPHFNLAGIQTGEYTYSYLLESHYNAFLEGVRTENPLSIENIKEWAAGNVQIDYTKFFEEPSIKIIEMSEDVHEGYKTLKEDLFDTYDTIGPILKQLTAYAKEHCKERKIPQEFKIFETPEKVQIIRTDLKIDEYLTGKLVSKMEEVNHIVEVLQ